MTRRTRSKSTHRNVEQQGQRTQHAQEPEAPPHTRRSAPPAETETEPRVESRPESTVSATAGIEIEEPPGIDAEIQRLEARLAELRSRRAAPEPASEPVAEPTQTVPRPTERWMRADGQDSEGTARELLTTDYYLKHWGRAAVRNRSEEVDELGLDPLYEAKYKPLFDFLHNHYFRIQAEGILNIPSEGRCLIVANHSSGPLPYDGLMLRTAVRLSHPASRDLRWLAEDFVHYLPFVGTIMNRLGAVRACQENAERLLRNERLVAVFPEGAKGLGKLYKERYRLQRFGRGGFIRLCLRTKTPLIPCSIVGGEESNPMLYRIETVTKAIGLPYFPITPTFPALGPLGLIPAPTKWHIQFGEPLSFDGYDDSAIDDELLVLKLAERVRQTIQAMIDRTLAGRRSVFL